MDWLTSTRPFLPEITAVTFQCPRSRSSPFSSAKPKKRAPPCRHVFRTRVSMYVRVGLLSSVQNIMVLMRSPVPIHPTQQSLSPRSHETKHQCRRDSPFPSQDRRGVYRVLQGVGGREYPGQLCHYLRAVGRDDGFRVSTDYGEQDSTRVSAKICGRTLRNSDDYSGTSPKNPTSSRSKRDRPSR